jgi:hypothetical protein
MLRLWLLLALAGGAHANGAERFDAALPVGMPGMTGWERIDGDAHDSSLEIAYRLYVNPELQGLYQVIRYRLRYVKPGSTVEKTYRLTEKLVWNETPGRGPLRCFELQSKAGEAESWRELQHASAEYGAEMQMVIRLLFLHRASPFFEGSAH